MNQYMYKTDTKKEAKRLQATIFVIGKVITKKGVKVRVIAIRVQ